MRIEFIAEAEIERQTLRDLPIILDERPKLPTPEASNTFKDDDVAADRGAKQHVRQAVAGSRRTGRVVRVNPGEIENPADRRALKRIVLPPVQSPAKAERVGAVSPIEDVFGLEIVGHQRGGIERIIPQHLISRRLHAGQP